MKAPREFGALVTPSGVWLVEYRAEREGYRVVGEWADHTHPASLNDALDRLSSMLALQNESKARLSIALDQFGTFHHMMVLPVAPDEVIRPVIQRDVQRTFGVADAVVAYTSGAPAERRESARADAGTAPRQVFIIGAARETLSALQTRLSTQSIELLVVTIVPVALRQLYQSLPDAIQPSVVLAALETGPQLAYFLGGRLELAVDPPIALEGESPSVDLVVDQVDRGNVYVRQQFQGATIGRLLLAARPDRYDLLAKALADRVGLRVQPLVANAGSPEALVAMGAALEAHADEPLSLLPRQPTWIERVRARAAAGSGVVAAGAAAALVIGLWAGVQLAQLSHARSELARSNHELQADLPGVQALRAVAERRADFASEIAFLHTTAGERDTLTAALASVANALPASARADTLRVSRTAAGWSGSLVGIVSGATAGEAVRGLNTLFETLRQRPGIAAAVLDEFDYAGARSQSDSTTGARNGESARPDAPIVIRYRISFTLRKGVSS